MDYKQLSLFDYIPKTREIKVGYIKNKEVTDYKGKMIPFQDLENYVGRYVLLEMPRYGAVSYKIIKITSYHKSVNKVYSKDNVISLCDQIGYSDDKKKEKENSWVSEHFCSNGRFEATNYPECMYEIRG